MYRSKMAAALRPVVLALAGLVAGAPPAGAAPSCAGQANCQETPSFTVAITDFRTSVAGGDRMATATLRFENKLKKPLVLGYVAGSGVVIDEKGTRYVAGPDSVRGIGSVAGGNVDGKFTLEPGESGDARLEFTGKGAKAGTTYSLDLTVQEFEPAGGQFKPGKERILSFADAGRKAGPAPAAVAPASTDPCAGLQRCANGGPFIAQVESLTPIGGPADRHHSLKLNVRFRNVSSQPVVLGYKSGSSAAIDNLGNGYIYGRPGTHDTSFAGIGLVTSRAADPSFVLKPGEARSAAFTVTRFNSGGKQLGTAWAWDVVVDELEILPSQQVRTGSEHSLHFPDLGASMPALSGAGAAAAPDLQKAVDDLKNLFRKK